MLKIYGRANSINVRKVLWAAEEIGLEYEREDWGRGFRPTSEPEFQKLNHLGLIPVIDDDGFILSEANTIVRYLCAKHQKTNLLPADPKGRAEVERWMDWQAIDFNIAYRPAFFALVVGTKLPGGDELVKDSLEDWGKKVGLVEKQLQKTGAYIAGPSFTAADIAMGVAINRWFMTPLDERPQYPAVSAYYEKLSERPAYQNHGRNGLP